jgi:hypothetical protein
MSNNVVDTSNGVNEVSAGKEVFDSLRTHYRAAEYRRFRVKDRSNRYAEMLGFTPDGKHMIGFWEGQDEVTRFAPDDSNWTNRVTYV